MEWHRLDSKLLLDADFVAASDAQIATWLRLLLFCAIQENEGRIRRARKLPRIAGLDHASVAGAVEANFAAWSGDDLTVRWFDLDGQRKCESNRRAGAMGGVKAKQNRGLVANGIAHASTHTDIQTNKPDPAPWALCGFHDGGRNSNRRAPFVGKECPECKHVSALKSKRGGGTKAIAALLPKVGT